jgi:peptidoglycan/LPS O-acetylase OafA/YrhL
MLINSYRADINGLRGIAILAVVFFHAGFDFASGGYVGVDIFFVLSGFLIFNSIQSSIKKDRFSLLTFYERRFLRILPAVITVAFLVSIVGYKLLFPEEIKELLESVQSFLMLRSNIWASESISYFGIGVGYKPLIHFWSLSIELQFYIFFPILLYFCLKNEAKLFLIIIVVIIFLVSLFYAIFWIEYNPSQGYFSSLMRVWQFSLGGILSLSGITSVVNSTSVKIRSTLVGFGLLLILLSVVIFDNSSLFPGKYALVPCLGAVLVLAFAGERDCFFSKFLSMRWLGFIGTISFSLYLVHQPIMAFYRVFLGRNLEGVEPLLLIFLSILVGVILYYAIEKPFQKKGNIFRLTSISYVFFLSTILFFTPNAVDFFKNQLSPEVKNYLKFRKDNNPRLGECRKSLVVPEEACLYGASNNPKVALWGDSHADQLVDPLAKEFNKYNHSVLEFAFPGCPPITNSKSPNKRNCTVNAKLTLNYLVKNKDIKHVILHAYWTGYFDNGLISPESDSISLHSSFRGVIKELLKAGKIVHLIYPAPAMKVNPPLYMARRAMMNYEFSDSLIELSKQEFEDQSKLAVQFLDNAAKGLDVNIIYISEYLFDSDRSVYPGMNGKISLYRDDNHLSVSGAKQISAALVDKVLSY